MADMLHDGATTDCNGDFSSIHLQTSSHHFTLRKTSVNMCDKKKLIKQ